MGNNHRTSASFWVLLIFILIILVISFFSSYLAPYDSYETDTSAVLQPPSQEHIFGTDGHGRDLFSRVLVGSKTSIFSTITLIFLTSTVGILIGMVGGYYGGWVDHVLMRITDVFLSFPNIILAIAVAGVLGGGLFNAMLALFFVTWTQYARLARSSTIAVKEEAYVQAAKLSGCSNLRILFFHILPNILGPLVVTATLHISGMMMEIAGLSFLGLGAKVPEPEWGSMISEGRKYLQIAPWVAIYPSLVMVLVMMLFNLFGDKVRDRLDPKQKSREIE